MNCERPSRWRCARRDSRQVADAQSRAPRHRQVQIEQGLHGRAGNLGGIRPGPQRGDEGARRSRVAAARLDCSLVIVPESQPGGRLRIAARRGMRRGQRRSAPTRLPRLVESRSLSLHQRSPCAHRAQEGRHELLHAGQLSRRRRRRKAVDEAERARCLRRRAARARGHAPAPTTDRRSGHRWEFGLMIAEDDRHTGIVGRSRSRYPGDGAKRY